MKTHIVILHIFALLFAAMLSSAASAQTCQLLCLAVENENLADVQAEIDGGANLDLKDRTDDRGETALYIAADRGFTAIVNALLMGGADPNILNGRDDETALFIAAKNNFAAIVNALIGAAGINVNLADGDGNTPLHAAVDESATDIVNALLAATGIDATLTNNDEETVLHTAASEFTENVAVANALIAAGVDVNAQDSKGRTALLIAADRGLSGVVNALLAETGINAGLTDDEGSTPLHAAAAAAAERTDIVNALLAADIDVNAEDNAGETAYDKATTEGYANILAILDTAIAATCMGAETYSAGTCAVLTPCPDATPIRDDTTNECRKPNSTAECTMLDRATGYYDDDFDNGGANARCIAPSETFQCAEISGEVGGDDQLRVFDDSVAGLCRTPNTNRECGESGLPRYYDSDNDNCRAPTSHAECREEPDDRLPFFTTDFGGTCISAASMEDCMEAYPADGLNLPIYDTDVLGNCRAREASDCEDIAATPVFNTADRTCRAAMDKSECPATRPIFDDVNAAAIATGNCRLPDEDAECLAEYGRDEPIHDTGVNDNCRLPADDGECKSSSQNTEPTYDMTQDDNCRLPMSHMECDNADSANPIFDMDLRACRELRDGDCIDPMLPYFNPTSTVCEVATEDAHCPSALPVFQDNLPDTGNCRTPNDNPECDRYSDGRRPIHDTNAFGDCRARDLSNCIGDQQLIPDPSVGNRCEASCAAHQVLNETTQFCDNRIADNCAATGDVFRAADDGMGGFCITPIAFLTEDGIAADANVYNTSACESAGWIVALAIENTRLNAAEVCVIPVVRDDSELPTATATEESPQQFPNLTAAPGCIMRAGNGFDKMNATPDLSTATDCNDMELFGAEGFPNRPENFVLPTAGNPPTDRLTVVVLPDGSGTRIFSGGNEVLRFVPPAAAGSSGNAQDSAKVAGIVGGVLGVVAIVHYFNTGGADAFSFSPDAGYSFTESGYSARFGGRAEYEIGEWDLYWTAGQTNTDGKFGAFRYGSGAKFDGEIWNAAFSESVRGETADYDLSLSADLRGGIWKVSPVYRMHSEWKESESGIQTETQNELNLEAEFRYNRWTITPSAGFGWQNFGEFADNGKFRMNAVYRF